MIPHACMVVVRSDPGWVRHLLENDWGIATCGTPDRVPHAYAVTSLSTGVTVLYLNTSTHAMTESLPQVVLTRGAILDGSERPLDASVENVRFINVRSTETDAAIVPVCQSHAISSYSLGNTMAVSSTPVPSTDGAILDGSDPPSIGGVGPRHGLLRRHRTRS